MSQALEKYLDRVMIYANRNDNDAPQIRAELQDHLLKKISDLQADGLSYEDAIFEAIEQHGHPRTVGYGLRPRFPLVDVRTHGTARGFIAIGPKAVGVFAFGGAAFGVFAFGGFALGLVAMGGFALAALLSFGGFSVALIGFAYGGAALGLVAYGGFACGVIAVGGMAIGCWVPDAGQGLSYFNAENVPNYIRYLDAILTDKHIIKFVMIGFYSILFPALLIQGLLANRERKRIENADPRLAE